MNGLQLELLENIRRIAERGRNHAHPTDSDTVDIFQHLLDLVEQIKEYNA